MALNMKEICCRNCHEKLGTLTIGNSKSSVPSERRPRHHSADGQKVMLSINDHPYTHHCFDGLVTHELKIKYSVGRHIESPPTNGHLSNDRSWPGGAWEPQSRIAVIGVASRNLNGCLRLFLSDAYYRPWAAGHGYVPISTCSGPVIEMSVRYLAIKLIVALPQLGQEPT